MVSWFTEENGVFHTAIVVRDTSSHPSHLWNLKNIILAVCWLDNMLVWPHLHHTAPHTLHSSVKYSFVQNRLKSAKLEENKLHKYCHASKLSENPLSYLYISRGVSTYLIPVSRTPDIHCHTSSLQSSGIELVWFWLTAAVNLLDWLLLSSFSWVSSSNSSSKFDIQCWSYVSPRFSTTVSGQVLWGKDIHILHIITMSSSAHQKCCMNLSFYGRWRLG